MAIQNRSFRKINGKREIVARLAKIYNNKATNTLTSCQRFQCLFTKGTTLEKLCAKEYFPELEMTKMTIKKNQN